jgi:hypothetical protein
MRRHRYQRALIFSTTSLGVALFLLKLVDSIPGVRVPPLLGLIASCMAAVLPNLVTSSIQSVLATIYPEDAPLVE